MRRKFRKREETNKSSDTEIQQHNWNKPLHKEEFSISEKKELTQEEINELKKNSQKIPLWPWAVIDEVVELFLSETKKWKNCFIEWNKKRVYAYEISNQNSREACDYTFKHLIWKTQLERDKQREEDRRKEELEKKRKKLETLEKIPWRIEEGKKYIDEARWEEWKNKVNDCVTNEIDSVLDDTLEILRMIELWESWENIQEAFKNQWHSWWSYNYVKSCVVYFSRKWKEADIYLK